MEIVICNRRTADRLLSSRGGRAKFRAVISICSVMTDPGSNRPPYGVRSFRGRRSHVAFDDIGHGEDGVPPTRDDVEKIIRFARTLSDGPIVIHCTAGVSRSAAAAVIVRAARGEDPFRDIDWTTHWPNRLMLELADEILGTSLAAEDERLKMGEGVAPEKKRTQD